MGKTTYKKVDNRKQKRLRSELNILFIAIGIYIGFELSRIGDFPIFKLLNIVGIFFDILGVLILTYVVTSSNKIKNFICTWGAVLSISAVAFIPIGTFASLIINRYLFNIASSSNIVTDIANASSYYAPIMFFCYGSVFFLEDMVFNVKIKAFNSQETKVKALGGYFLLCGLSIQLFASFLDLLDI